MPLVRQRVAALLPPVLARSTQKSANNNGDQYQKNGSEQTEAYLYIEFRAKQQIHLLKRRIHGGSDHAPILPGAMSVATPALYRPKVNKIGGIGPGRGKEERATKVAAKETHHTRTQPPDLTE